MKTENILASGVGFLAGYFLFNSNSNAVGKLQKGYYDYRVSATLNGERVTTEPNLFRTKAEAKNYAAETNKFRPGSNARVVKVFIKE